MLGLLCLASISLVMAVGPDSKVEGDQLIRPTLVTLDIQDRPMAEVIRDLSVKTGCPLRIYELQKDWLAERITLREPAPVPFWKAVDRLCEAGHFQYNLGSDARGASVSFFRDEISGPASDYGAFRVQLEEIYYNRSYRKLHLGRDHSSRPIFRERDRDKSYIELRIMVEPRMMIRNNGASTGLIVVDDLGQSLLPVDPEAGQPHDDFDYTPCAFVLVRVPLKLIEHPGRVIRQLRGVAPVAVAARRSKPLIIPLAGAAGRSFQSGESVVTIRRVGKITLDAKITVEPFDPEEEVERPQPITREATCIELTIRSIDRPGTPIHGAEPRKPAHSRLDLPDLSEEQFEVVDADGKVWEPSPWWLSDTRPERLDGETRVRLIPVGGDLSPWKGDLAGVKLRYYDMAVMKVEVPFQFTDIELP